METSFGNYYKLFRIQNISIYLNVTRQTGYVKCETMQQNAWLTSKNKVYLINESFAKLTVKLQLI